VDEISESLLREIDALEAFRGQLHNLAGTIADLLALNKSIPEGELRNNLFDEISALDSIADVMRQTLDW
jgi:hypothetical protein